MQGLGKGAWCSLRMNVILDRFTGNISPVALLVSSFFWSWVDIAVFSPALFLTAGCPIDVTPYIVSFVSSVLFLAIFSASTKVRSYVLNARVFAICSLICGSLGTLLIWVGLHTSPLLLIMGGVLIGAYQSVGVVVAGGIATCQGTTNALVHLAAALPLNTVAILLVVFLRPMASVVFTVALPLFSALCYAVFLMRGNNCPTLRSIMDVKEKQLLGKPNSPKRVFGCEAYFLLMVLALCVSFGFVNFQALFTQNVHFAVFDYATLVVRAATSLAVLVGYLLYSWRPYSILRVALLLMSVGLIASGVMSVADVPGTFLSNILILTGYACFDLLIWTIIVMLGYRSGVSLLQLICVVYTVDQFGNLVGTSLGLLAADNNAVIIAYIMLGSVLLLVAFGFSSGKSAVKERLSVCEIEFGKAESAASIDSHEILASQRYRDRIAEVSARFFLTSREIDVLALLVAGRNGPFISEHLHVSDNTVKSHIRHIYTKLNVHNRQELLNLVFPLEG